MDPLANLIELDAMYNHILDGLLPMKIVHEAWKSAQDHSLAFMQMLWETCSPPRSRILDLIVGTCLCLNLFQWSNTFLTFAHKIPNHAPFYDVGSIFITTCESSHHVFGLAQDKTLYATRLSTL